MTHTPEEVAVAEAINATGLVGCGCCVYGEAYDRDGCPIDAQRNRDGQ